MTKFMSVEEESLWCELDECNRSSIDILPLKRLYNCLWRVDKPQLKCTSI